ncbi:ATP-binding cassette domain-containing protein [Pelagibius litoralis]|uniref:ATP-binding cassette domain-containing protein n=1 Tax=Pelagibius litoralis TaxID=374515 RepID=A0A967F1Y0_9PROT|nr:ATP-binding cassette domain-containing protein [Pelagibius litoralis]NIA71543.1 ATP-binding cassette domain-containing protein [Pelagibius litoralis]
MTVVSVAKDYGLALRQVELAHGGQRFLGPLSLTVAPGEVVTVMGPSGCGKSSLLAFVCGTLDPALTGAGRLLLNGAEIGDRPPEERRIGILFQDDLLFPHLSVAGNLAFGLPPEMRDRKTRRARIEEALAEADMAEFYDRDPVTLSGGQRARVALLRTLLSEPCALLLDEPFAKLDVALRARFRSFVFDHARAQALPTLLVTHDPQDATDAGGPVLEIDAAGRMLATKTPRLSQSGPHHS